VGQVVAEYRTALPAATVYVYDNNSTDATAAVAEAAGAIVRTEHKQGKGNVMRSMFRDVEADCYVLVDGDDTYPAGAVPEMVRLVLEDGADMVVGDRLSSTYFTENTRRFHGAGNVLVRWLVNRLFRGDVRDIMSGLRVMSWQFVKSYPVVSEGFEIETDMTIHALDHNLAVRSVEVDYRDRPVGSESKLDTTSDGVKVLATIGRLLKDYRPLAFFGSIAAVLAVVAVGLMVPIVVTFLQTGLVPKFPTLIVAVVLGLAAGLSLVCGLILATHTNARRKHFQLYLNLLSLHRQG
jgi:glycosyltransferase involved in cell wall biosynthesis